MASMYPSRAAQTSLKSLPPSCSVNGTRASRSSSRALRSGARQAWFQPCLPPLQPQSERQRSMPCTQLQEVFSTISPRTRAETAPGSAVIGQLDGRDRLPAAAARRPAPFRRIVVMAVGFAICRHMDQLRLRVVFEAAFEPRGKVLAGVEQPLEGDGPRGRAVVEKDGNRDAGIEADQIRTGGVHAGVGSIRPAAPPSSFSGRMRLHWCGASTVNLMPCWASSSSDSLSAAVSASHMPSGARRSGAGSRQCPSESA